MGIASEKETKIEKSKKKWKIDFPLFSNVETSMAKKMNMYVTSKLGFSNGISQPGVAVILGEGKRVEAEQSTSSNTIQEDEENVSCTDEGCVDQPNEEINYEKNEEDHYDYIYRWKKNKPYNRIHGGDAWNKVIRKRVLADNPLAHLNDKIEEKLKILGMTAMKL
mmetsp:Transcript_226/g.398  ORF Transcript_226/g.398 Transcript_226/m.398 type:complete len:165 (-) Transcript_226:3558-4052(-)